MNLSMNKLSFFIAACLIIQTSAWAELRDFQTTRLVSTSGAGVGSILMDEATILNPASLAFFTVTSLYVQKNKGEFTPKKDQASPPAPSNEKQDELNFIASDGNGSAGASLSYLTQDSGASSRKRWGLALASPVDKTSAMGIAAKRTTDEINETGRPGSKDTYNQFVVGVLHAMSPNFSLGLVGHDVTKAKSGETRALVGLQYVYEDFIVIMIDGGVDYTQSLSDSAQYRGAVQFKVFSDFYLRAGAYEDKAKHERGNSAGISWVSPKIVIEIAIASKALLANENVRTYSMNLKETAFSLSYRF